MKPIFYLVTVIFISLYIPLCGQERIPSTNTQELIFDGEKSYEIGEYEDALEYFNQINPNDTNGFLAFYETVLTLNALEKYDECIALIESSKPIFWKKEPMLYNVYGTALKKNSQIPRALECFNRGQEDWPLNASISYNKALTLWDDKQYDEAFKTFERTLELNPFHWNTHRKLGDICANEGYITEALMCYNMCLLSDYNYYYSDPILNSIEKLVSSNISAESQEINIYGEGGVSPHEELTFLIKNRVALDRKKYKFKHKLFKLNIIKQNHFLISHIIHDDADDSFWGRYYTKHFSKINTKGHKEGFGYATVLGWADVYPKIGKTLLKNRNALEDYLIWARDNWAGNFSEIRTPFRGEMSTNDVYRYKNGSVYLVGHKSEKDANGYGETYHPSGVLSGKGKFNMGVQDGYWVNYHEDGSIGGEFNVTLGELNGTSVYYDDFGEKSRSLTFKNGKPFGPSKNYQSGVLNYATNLEDGKFNGQFNGYFPDGSLKYTFFMNNGEADGAYKSFYANGNIETEFSRTNKKIEGTFKTYFPDGKIYKQIQFENDKENGPFAYYFYNGNKSSEGMFKDGKYAGTYKTYFNDGTLSSESYYDNSGKENGTESNYAKQGWKLSEFQFRKGEIVAYKFFDDKGNVLKEAKKKGGEFYYESVDKDGTITVKGTYSSDDKGEQGEWKTFNRNEYLESVINYKGGKREGLYTSYFANKQVKVECNYKNGKQDGYFKENYQQGQIYRQGWIEEGELEGLWETYFEDGTISTRKYYIDDQIHGYEEDYSPTGVRTFAKDYRFGTLIGLAVFDTIGVELNYYPIDTGLTVINQHSAFGYLEAEKIYNNRKAYGEWKWYYPNKQVSVIGEFLNGERNGKWLFYYSNGQISSEGNYFLGKKTGEWRAYHLNGTLDKIEVYEYGQLSGKNLRYNEDGILETELEYVQGLRHGLAKYFSKDGKLQMLRKYEFGEIISVAVDKFDLETPTWVNLKNETGEVITKYPNGQIARKFSLVKGDFQGKYDEYYDNGQIRDTQVYLDNERHGDFKSFYNDGTLKSDGVYTYGELNGAYKTYYSNGKLKAITNYINDQAHGWSEEYNSAGKLQSRKYYYNGSLEIIEGL